MAKGGRADKSKGGGGSGGRIALYHASSPAIPPYRGDFQTQGGAGNSAYGAEPGASGTVIIRNETSGHTRLQVDNNGQAPVSEDTNIRNEGYRIDLSHVSSVRDKSKSFLTKDGHGVQSSTDTYSLDSSEYCVYGWETDSFSLASLFDQTLSDNKYQYYMSSSNKFTLTIHLKEVMFINKIKIFPTKSHPSVFKVT